MTVCEMIKFLSEMQPDCPVLIRAYGEVSTPKVVRKVELARGKRGEARSLCLIENMLPKGESVVKMIKARSPVRGKRASVAPSTV